MRDALQKTIATFVTSQHCVVWDEEISTLLNLYISQKGLPLSKQIEFFKIFLQWSKFDALLKPIILSQFTFSLLEKKNKKIRTEKAMMFRFLVDVVFMNGPRSLCQPFQTADFQDTIFEFSQPQGSKNTVEAVFMEELTTKTLRQETDWFWTVVIVLMNSR